jgi:phosphomannomutase
VPIGRSETFVPIDTEAHRPQDVAFIREAMATSTSRATELCW